MLDEEDAMTDRPRDDADAARIGRTISDAESMTQPRDARAEQLATARTEDVLTQLTAQALMRRLDSPFYTNEQFIAWLDDELDSPDRSCDGWDRERVRTAGARLYASASAVRLHVRPARGLPPFEAASIVGTIPQVLDDASHVGAAPHLDLAAAAGVGRDLWDEPCDQWVRVPSDLPRARYVALRVSGESMVPLLHTGDTVLVQLGPSVAPNTVVLVRVPEGGYVVKRVIRVTRTRLELGSLNPVYPPITVLRTERTVVGTVVLRWERER